MFSSRKKRIKILVWVYLALLIFEGALRKWFLPFLSTPILLIRDPLALLALFWSWPLLVRSVYWPRVQVILYIGLAGIVLTLYFGHGDWFTALYGLRIFWIQLPFIFVFPLVFTNNDVIKALWATVAISFFMVILITAQSTTPPSHILNVAPGGAGSSAFDGAGGKFRPSGIFSFTNSVTSFFTFSAASLMSIIYGLDNNNNRKKNANNLNQRKSTILKRVVILLGAISLVVALPVSISRGLLAGYAVVFIITVGILISTRTKVVSLLAGLVVIYCISMIMLNIPVVKDAAQAFALRWELAASADTRDKGNAQIIEGQLRGRVLRQYLEPFVNRDHYPLIGHGIGKGTNIGAVRLSGSLGLLLSESSWGRQMEELGLFLGCIFIFWRISFALYILRISIKYAFTNKNKVAIILSSMSISGILAGQLGQSSGLGFIVGTTGLTIAATISYGTSDQN